jgi:endonuclease/exonuclease/phosphatase family metal-dependent hydrolase
VKEPLAATEVERLELSMGRSAHRSVVTLPNGATVLVVVTHLHHEVDGASERDAQAAAILGWLAGARASDATIAMGDFNADPREPTYARMVRAGFRSAYAEANGAEPAVTWPSGLQAPAMDTDGDPDCLDYIWVRGTARVVDARLAFDRPDPEDPTLYPSDHLGISAHLEIG